MNTIISKRPTSFVYTKWLPPCNGIIEAEYSITINGGSGVMNPKSLVTPQGVVTFVDDKTLDKLKQIDKFNRDVERGLIRIEAKEKISDPEKIEAIASSGKMIDDADIKSRPITTEDLENDGAVINSDGSVDISEGGKTALKRRNDKAEKVKKTAKKGK